VRVEEPAADLGVALAIASALRDVSVEAGHGVLRGVGLTGDVRFVSGGPRRVAELMKLATIV
jgi:DNA repair protein RadA/Sms